MSSLDSPLEGNKIDNIFKLYVTDTGLFISMLDDDTMKNILFGDIGIYKGAIYENVVADAFIKNKVPLYYFSKSSGLEIDFVSKYQQRIALIEVKATNGNAKSSRTVLNDKIKYPNVDLMIKLCQSNLNYMKNVFTVPYYLAYLIK